MDDFKPNCDQCEAVFTKPQALLLHIEEVHGTLKCPYCKYEAMSDKNLRQHIKNHENGASFICKFCHFITRSMPNLNRHIQYMHTNERQYVCDYCSFATVEEHKLKAHMRVHSGERPFKCLTCNKSFKHLVSLQRHLVLHTDSKCNICILCFQVFRLTLTLRNHMKKVHCVDKGHIEGIRKCKEIGIPRTVEWYINKLGVTKEFVFEKYSDLTFYEIKPVFAMAFSKHFQRVAPLIWIKEQNVSDNSSKIYSGILPRGMHSRLFLSDLGETDTAKQEFFNIATGVSEQEKAIEKISNQEKPLRPTSEMDSQSSRTQAVDQEIIEPANSVEIKQTETKVPASHNQPPKTTSRVKKAKTRKKADPWEEDDNSVEGFLNSDSESDYESDNNVELLLPNKRKRGLMLKKMRAGEYGSHPRIIKVLEDGTIIDTTENFKEFLPCIISESK